LRQNFVVPKSKDDPAETLQTRSPLAIALEFVLPAIRLDDNLTFNAREIRHERADGFLTPEFETGQIAIAQMTP